MEKRIRKSEIGPEVKQVGSRIEAIIKAKGFKTREVAHDADMDVENLRKYIKGKQEMKISTLLKIVKALDVKIEELFWKIRLTTFLVNSSKLSVVCFRLSVLCYWITLRTFVWYLVPKRRDS